LYYNLEEATHLHFARLQIENENFRVVLFYQTTQLVVPTNVDKEKEETTMRFS